MPEPLHVVVLTNLYPNAVQVRRGIFIRERLRHLVDHEGLRISVIAPVPWFPLSGSLFGSYGEFAAVPHVERDLGMTVYHPRYFILPKVGDFLTPLTYAAAVWLCIQRNDLGPIDVIDAHFFFPDGAAAVLLSDRLACPVSVTARGSDINRMLDEFFAGRWIRWCVRKCDAAVSVSDALSRKLVEAGAPGHRMHTIPNGVDASTFAIRDRERCRGRLGLRGPLVLSVGNLVRGKGHHYVVDAVARMPDVQLLVVGSGPMRKSLNEAIISFGICDRVRIVGEVGQSELVDYYNAADVLVLATESEGMPNVVLESMSCGTPVIATAVGGLSDFMASSGTARILKDRSPGTIVAALRQMLDDPPDRHRIRAEVASRNWSDTSNAVCDLLRGLVPEPRDCRHESVAAQNAV